MRESKIQRWYVKSLEAHNVDCVKLYVKGWPDYLCIAGSGNSCFIEFKRTGQVITDPHQFARRKRLEGKGHTVFEVNRISETTLEQILVCLGEANRL